MRHGRKSSATTFNGCKEHRALDVDSHVTREVVVCPANQPEHEAVELLAAALAQGPGLFQLDSDLGYMASPRIAQWAAQGVHIIARPWPQSGPLVTTDDVTLDVPHGTVTGPNGQTVPMVLGKNAQCPASAWDVCPRRAQCTTARLGHGRSLTIREDEQFQQKLRAKIKTKRGRAALRKRTAVELRLPIMWPIAGGEPALRDCARISVTVVVMQRSATCSSLPVIRRNVNSLLEVLPNWSVF